MILDELLRRAREIESETADSANTARRVGSLFVDLIDALRAAQSSSLSSVKDDTAQGHILFKNGLTAEQPANLNGGLQVGDGARIDKNGHAALQSLVLREWMEVPELRLNRTTVHLGASFNSPAVGIVKEVAVFDDHVSGRVDLKLEAGELGTVQEGDLLMGIFHATNEEWGASADSDNGRLDVQFAGFATAYFEVTFVHPSRQWFTYTLREGTFVHPKQFMNFASRGNRHDPLRQKFCFATRSYTRFLVGVNDWEIQSRHLVMQMGELDNLHALGFSEEVTGVGIYAENSFLSGKLQVGGSFKTVQEVVESVEDKAIYTEYSADGSSNWHFPYREGDFFMRQKRGANGTWGVAMRFIGKDAEQFDIEVLEGSTFYRAEQGFVGKFRATYKVGGKDVTDTLHPSRIKWTRESSGEDDAHWNDLHANIFNPITITTDDIVGNTALIATLYEANGLPNSSSSINL